MPCERHRSTIPHQTDETANLGKACLSRGERKVHLRTSIPHPKASRFHLIVPVSRSLSPKPGLHTSRSSCRPSPFNKKTPFPVLCTKNGVSIIQQATATTSFHRHHRRQSRRRRNHQSHRRRQSRHCRWRSSPRNPGDYRYSSYCQATTKKVNYYRRNNNADVD